MSEISTEISSTESPNPSSPNPGSPRDKDLRDKDSRDGNSRGRISRDQNSRAPQRVSGTNAEPKSSRRTGGPWFVYLATCGVLGLLFLVYHFVVPPLLESPVPARSRPVLQVARPRKQLDRDKLFPPGAWERGLCKVLYLEQGVVIFKDYQPQPDGRVEVWPLTVVLETAESVANGMADNHPVLIHAERASLQFDKPFSLGSGFGELQSAMLNGEVLVVRQPAGAAYGGAKQIADGGASAQAKDQGILIETRDVQLTPERVFALQPVNFRIGEHFGRGRNLMIDLARETPQSTFAETRVRRAQLQQVDFLMLQPDREGQASWQPGERGRGELGKLPNPKQPEMMPGFGTGATGSVPVKVTCHGPLDFDFEKNSVTLSDEVLVQRQDNDRDQLACVSLELFFKSRTAGAEAKHALESKTTNANLPDQRVAPDDRTKELKLTQVIALGSPARLTLNSRSSVAQANSIRYDVKNEVATFSHGNVLVVQGGESISSASLQYHFPADRSLGVALADGPGWLKSSRPRGEQDLADTQPEQFRIEWSEKMLIRPDSGLKAVSFYGHTACQFGTDWIRANELHIWLAETQASNRSQPQHSSVPDNVSPQNLSPRNPVPRKLSPRKLAAVGDVEIDAADLAGKTNRIEAYWVELPEPNPATPQSVAGAPDPGRTPLRPPTAGQPIAGRSNRVGKSKILFASGRIRLSLAEAMPAESTAGNGVTKPGISVEDLWLEEGATVRQVDLSPTDQRITTTGGLLADRKLEMAAESIHVLPQVEGLYRIEIFGASGSSRHRTGRRYPESPRCKNFKR